MRKFLLLLAGACLFTGAASAADAIPATSYFPVLPFDAAADATPQWVPLASNNALDQGGTQIGRAIIIVHDQSRDANGAVATMSALAGTANSSTLILAPQFLLPSDLARFSSHLPDNGRSFVSWPLTTWPQGGDSTAIAARQNLSSFTVIDLLLMYLADHERFPALQTVVIAGYGTGADFVQRYAAFSLAADVLFRQNISLRFIAAAPSSYLYLTATRPMGGRNGFGRPDLNACPDYNAYPYGLEKLPSYARRVGANAAKGDYGTRFMTYLSAPISDPGPDSTCAATAQGPDIATRTANYSQYLQTLYGDVASKTQNFSWIKDAKADAVGLFGSPCGMAVLFGDGICAASFRDAPTIKNSRNAASAP